MSDELESFRSARAYDRMEPNGGNQLLRAIVTLQCIIFPHRAAANWPIADAESKLIDASSIEGHWVSSNIGDSARLERETSHLTTVVAHLFRCIYSRAENRLGGLLRQTRPIRFHVYPSNEGF